MFTRSKQLDLKIKKTYTNKIMDIKLLEEKKQNLSQLMNEKVSKLQQIENTRNQLTTEIIELRGKISLIEELLKAETPK